MYSVVLLHIMFVCSLKQRTTERKQTLFDGTIVKAIALLQSNERL
jgi:hypothetical protein